jgi:phosphate acetyltransferase
MVRLGQADGSVAGATNTTSHTVRAALHCIGVRPGFKLVSSFFNVINKTNLDTMVLITQIVES